MYITIDMSLRDLLIQMLQHNSVHTILYMLADIQKYHSPEEFANICNKLLEGK